MAKIVLAVSGGVDSMVMLDLACRSGLFKSDELVVAHFDHGIRANSAKDADFVRQKAAEYGIEFCLGRAELDATASEAQAREARYEFLQKVAHETNAQKIWTAHHLDDLIETVAINFIRGTGWRGLAVFNRTGIERPLLKSSMIYEPLDKNAVFEYAGKRKLCFREDQTNSSDEYLRNRIREQIQQSDIPLDQKMYLYELWLEQSMLTNKIDHAVVELLPEDNRFERSWFQNLDEKTALELLRAGTLRVGISATRPQLEEFRQSILNYSSGKYFNLPKDHLVRFTKTHFVI